MRSAILALGIFALSMFPAPSEAAFIVADGASFSCSDNVGVTCCDFPTIDKDELAGAERPQRIAKCGNGETFFVKVPFYPLTAGRNWTADMDIALTAAETNRGICFDMSSAAVVRTVVEGASGDSSFGNTIELASDAFTATTAYQTWGRMYGEPTVPGASFIPYRSSPSAANCTANAACTAASTPDTCCTGSGTGTCDDGGTTCRAMPIWFKYTRDDGNTGCTADPANDVAVDEVIFGTN